MELPPVDSVIRQAGRTARASTAAAAAVLTVGALGGVTAVTHVGEPGVRRGRGPGVGRGRPPPSAARPARPARPRPPSPPSHAAVPTTTTTRPAAPAPPPPSGVVPWRPPRRPSATSSPAGDDHDQRDSDVDDEDSNDRPSERHVPERPARAQPRDHQEEHARSASRRPARRSQVRVMPRPASQASRSWPCAASPSTAAYEAVQRVLGLARVDQARADGRHELVDVDHRGAAPGAQHDVEVEIGEPPPPPSAVVALDLADVEVEVLVALVPGVPREVGDGQAQRGQQPRPHPVGAGATHHRPAHVEPERGDPVLRHGPGEALVVDADARRGRRRSRSSAGASCPILAERRGNCRWALVPWSRGIRDRDPGQCS